MFGVSSGIVIGRSIKSGDPVIHLDIASDVLT
jgi:hypothetical protein